MGGLKRRKYARMLIYLFGFTCFFQAQILKVQIGGIEVAFNRILILLLLGDFLLSVLKSKKISVTRGYYYKFVLVWIAWQGVNFFQGSTRNFSGWIKLTWLILIYLTCAFSFKKYLDDKEKFIKLLVCFQLGILIQLIIGFFEHMTGIYYWTGYKETFTTVAYYINKKFPCAIQNNPNDFAVLMFIGVFLSTALIKIYKNKFMKLLSAFIIIGGVYLILISDSRSTLLGLVFGCVYIVYFLLKSLKSLSKSMTVLIILILITGIGFVYLRGDIFIELFKGRLQFNFSSGGSEKTRILLLIDSFKAFLESCGIGIGWHGTAWHNYVAEILAESGIVIFVCYIGYWVSLFKGMNITRKYGCDREERIISLVFSGMMGGMLFAFIGPASILNIEWVGVIFGAIMLFISITNSRIKCNGKIYVQNEYKFAAKYN